MKAGKISAFMLFTLIFLTACSLQGNVSLDELNELKNRIEVLEDENQELKEVIEDEQKAELAPKPTTQPAPKAVVPVKVDNSAELKEQREALLAIYLDFKDLETLLNAEINRISLQHQAIAVDITRIAKIMYDPSTPDSEFYEAKRQAAEYVEIMKETMPESERLYKQLKEVIIMKTAVEIMRHNNAEGKLLTDSDYDKLAEMERWNNQYR